MPAYDSALRVHVARDGRVLAASGPPLGGLSLPAATPQPHRLAGARSRRRTTSARRAGCRAPRRARPAARHHLLATATAPASSSSSRRAATGSPGASRSRARIRTCTTRSSTRRSGEVLARHSLTDFAVSNALVFDYHPGAASGGSAAHGRHRQMAGRLGDHAHRPERARLRRRQRQRHGGQRRGDRRRAAGPTGSTAVSRSASAAAARSAYLHVGRRRASSTEQTNRAQATTQVFYYVNTFHDWLAQPAIGFTPAASDFEARRRPAATTRCWRRPTTGRDGSTALFNNANMTTPPDGQSPRMQMYLFKSAASPAVNGGDDASVVYHEYTHGLSNRPDRRRQRPRREPGPARWARAGATGTRWTTSSQQGFVADTDADGEVVVGEYVTGDSVGGIRRQPLDCPVGSDAPGLPRQRPRRARGGFTYADLGRVGGFDASTPRFEVHDDGEIWSETLWDLRKALGASTAARADHERDAPLAGEPVVPRRARRDPARRPGRRRRCEPRRDLAGVREPRHGLRRADHEPERDARDRLVRACRSSCRAAIAASTTRGALGDGDGVAEPGEAAALRGRCSPTRASSG